MLAGHTSDDSAGPLAEFSALRQEIDRRSTAQQAILVLQITAAGAVGGFVLRDPGKIVVLLVVPLASFAFCSIYLENAFQIHRIGSYVRHTLSKRVPGGLGWESWSRDRPPNWAHNVTWNVSLFAMFPLVAAAALAWSAHAALSNAHSLTASAHAGLTSIWAFGLLATVVMTVLIVILIGIKDPGLTKAGSTANEI